MPAPHHSGRAQAAGPVSPLIDLNKVFSPAPSSWKSNKWPLKATDLQGYASASTSASGSRNSNTNGSGSHGSGSGSATGSRPQDNFSRDDRDESSSSDDPQVGDVKKGPEQLEKNNSTNFPSLQRDGPTPSLGSADHPECKPCAFYCYSLRGCRNAHNCTYCHLFHESKLRQRRDEWKREQRDKRGRIRRDVKDGSESQSAIDGACLNASFTEITSSAQRGPQSLAGSESSVGAVQAAPFQAQGDEGRLVPRLAYASEYQQGAPWPTNRPAQVSVNNSVASTVAAIADVVAMTQDLVQRMPHERSNQFPDPDPKLEFYSHNPSSAAVGVGQHLEIWPPTGVFEAGMVFAVSPDLPQGVFLDQHSGVIHGIPKHPTRGLTSFFVTACKPGVHVKNVKTSMVKINVVMVQAPGYTVASLYQPEPGLTVVALREDMGQSHFPQQQPAWDPTPGWMQPPSALSYDTSPNEAAGAMMRLALEARQRAALWGRDCPPSL